tara:strand:- start:3331 stop:3576 length:246 start_codon:yes stop_codon:yes gene_type:complete
MGKQKNRKTEIENLISDITGKHSKRMNALMMTMDDEDFTVCFWKGIEYALPKLQRTEILQDEKETNITIEHVHSIKPPELE